MYSISNQFISENLIEGYVKTPNSLKEQALTKLSIHLCECSDLKKHIIFERGKQNLPFLTGWDSILEQISSIICVSLVPYALRPTLKCGIRSIAIRLRDWNQEHQIRLAMAPQDVHQILIPSDWTVEGRINERKVAERIVQNEGIVVSKRYQLACLHFLENFIYPLWNRIPPAFRKGILHNYYPDDIRQSNLVTMWSHYLIGIDRMNVSRLPTNFSRWFCKDGLRRAVNEGQRSAFIYCWNMLSESNKQKLLVSTTLTALSMYNKVRKLTIPTILLHLNKCFPRPAQYIDIVYFLFSWMSEEQRVHFFKISFVKYSDVFNYDSAFLCFLEHPYQSYFMPIISKLWGILPEAHYGRMIYTVAQLFSRSWAETEYLDYNYGGLLLELLDNAPENYKIYVFSETSLAIIRNVELGKKLLDMAIKTRPFEYKNIVRIQNILKRIPVEEMQSIMHSPCAEEFIEYFIENRKLEMLDTILVDCLPEKGIIVRKNFLLSMKGKKVCFRLIVEGNVGFVNSLLNWGYFSKEEVSDFKLKLIDLNAFSCEPRDLLSDVKFDYFDKVLEWCLPSECARQEFREMYLKLHAEYIW